jgi:hypothetical protein
MKRSSQIVLVTSSQGIQGGCLPPSSKRQRLNWYINEERTTNTFCNGPIAYGGNKAPPIYTRSPRVRFCPFVQVRDVPSLIDPQEKQALHYTRLDYLEFAKQEKARRSIFRLAQILIKQQSKRLRQRHNLISTCKVAALFHRALHKCRRERGSAHNAAASGGETNNATSDRKSASVSSRAIHDTGSKRPFSPVYARAA